MLQAEAGHRDYPKAGQVFADWTGSRPLAHLPVTQLAANPGQVTRPHGQNPASSCLAKPAQTHRKAAER